MKIKVTSRHKAYGTWIEGTADGLRFQAQIFDTGDRRGINGGQVIRFTILRGLRTEYSYDRGSVVKRSSAPDIVELYNYVTTNAESLRKGGRT